MNTKDLILKLYEINVVKFGEFKLKSGIMSPIYIDLRQIISYPEILKKVSNTLWDKIKNLKFDLICGVPYTAIPIATVISIEHNQTMIMRKKEVKDYGTKKAVEGVFTAGQTVVLFDDLVTSGLSVFETVEPLEHEGLKVTDIVVLLDREQGGKDNLASKGYNLHSIFTISELLTVLLENDKINQETYDNTTKFIKENQVKK